MSAKISKHLNPEVLKLQKKVIELEGRVIYGWYEEEYPTYCTAKDELCELHEEVTVEDLNGLIKMIKGLKDEIDHLKGNVIFELKEKLRRIKKEAT